MVKLTDRVTIDTGNIPDNSVSIDDITGLTATADELNKMDGVTATTEEINLLDAAPATVNIALAAGAANTMTVTMTVQDAAGATLAGVYHLEWWISEAATGIGLTGDSYSGDVTTTTGTEMEEVVTKKHFRGITAATGILVGSAVASAKPADQYIAVKHPLTGQILVSAASGANWGA